MGYRRIIAGSTSQLIEFPIYDSTSTTGALKTGLTYSSMTAYYYREGASGSTSMSLATMTMGTWATLGFVAVDGTNMPGIYQLGIPNAAIATGCTQVTIYLTATGCVPVVLVIELTSVTDYPANMTQILGTAVSSPATAGILDVNLKNIANSAVSTASAQLGVNVVTQANIDFGATQKASITAAVPTVVAIQSGLATPTNITAGTITTVTNLTNAPTAGDLTSTMKTSITTACTAATPTCGVSGDLSATMKTSVGTAVSTQLNTAIPGSPTAGSIFQYIQALKWALLNKMAITDANGNTVGYEDDDATQAFSVSGMFTDNSTTTTRLRPL
jgi:hypothetical protein